MRGNDGKNCLELVRDHEARSSNLRTSTITKSTPYGVLLLCLVLAERTPLQALLEWSAPSDQAENSLLF